MNLDNDNLRAADQACLYALSYQQYFIFTLLFIIFITFRDDWIIEINSKILGRFKPFVLNMLD